MLRYFSSIIDILTNFKSILLIIEIGFFILCFNFIDRLRFDIDYAYNSNNFEILVEYHFQYKYIAENFKRYWHL